jgi:hypothetical protein
VTTEELALLVIELKQAVEELKGEVRRISAPTGNGQTWLPVKLAVAELRTQGINSEWVLRDLIRKDVILEGRRNVGSEASPRWEICIEIASAEIARYKSTTPDVRRAVYS